MTNENRWNVEHRLEVAAAPETLWGLFRDVSSWKQWNAGIESIQLDGEFAKNTWFTMKPPGQDALRSQLVEVRENECFVDETRVDGLTITVAHRLQPLGKGRTQVTYALEATGPGAAEVGPMVAADFPDVLAALAKHAARTPRA